VQEALGRIEARQLAGERGAELRESEFRTFSQWGEDGIIQRLVHTVPIERKLFVEFGVQDYSESNTRFLLLNDNWSGLVMDGDEANIAAIRRSDLFWRHNIKAQRAFVTRENIDELLRGNGVEGDIGLLSIDIDGNDYWVWEAISSIAPRIVIAEYNARFGPQRAVTIPYDPAFTRQRAHYSMIYYGASLAALTQLGKRKGYALVGCNSAGNNAFFVRRDCMPASLQSALPNRLTSHPLSARRATNRAGCNSSRRKKSLVCCASCRWSKWRDEMVRQVTVTGAYGFIGRHVARRLAAAGWRVIGMGHGSWSREDWKAWGIDEWHAVDITLETLVTVCRRARADRALRRQRIGCVLCCASLSGFSAQRPDHDRNPRICAAACAVGAHRSAFERSGLR
jgi:hypothetical protein